MILSRSPTCDLQMLREEIVYELRPAEDITYINADVMHATTFILLKEIGDRTFLTHRVK